MVSNSHQYIFKAVTEPITRINTIVGYHNTGPFKEYLINSLLTSLPEDKEISLKVNAHYALVRYVRLGDSFENEFLNRSGMWRFYRFQSTETDENAVLSISFTAFRGLGDVFYSVNGYPTTERVISMFARR